MVAYTVRRVSWLLWRWEVARQDGPGGRGLSLSKRAARWAARNHIRGSGRAEAHDDKGTPLKLGR